MLRQHVDPDRVPRRESGSVGDLFSEENLRRAFTSENMSNKVGAIVCTVWGALVVLYFMSRGGGGGGAYGFGAFMGLLWGVAMLGAGAYWFLDPNR